MTIDFKIDEKDFLTHQLFVASKSERIKRKRQRNKIVLPIGYIGLGLLSLLDGKIFLTIIFFIIGLLWFFIYPFWERRYYMKYYKRLIKENYKDRIGEIVSLEFNNDYFLTKDHVSESKILTTELLEIYEISTTIFVRLKGGQSFLLPKDKVNGFESIRARLKKIAKHLKIQYVIDEKWAWK